MSTVKRIFLYGVASVNLAVFASGVIYLLWLVFDLLFGDEGWRSFAQTQLSMGLAMLIIGGTLWFLFWRMIQREASGNPDEAGSGIRKLYMNLVLIITTMTGLSNIALTFEWILSGMPFDRFPSVVLSSVIVCICLWLYHWKVENSEGQPSPEAQTIRRWYIYITVAYGLIVLTNGIVQIVNGSSYYLPVWGRYTREGGIWDDILKANISWIVTGGLAWWYFWFRLARDDFRSTLRQVYLYVLTVTGSVVAGLAALTTIIYQLLALAFGGSHGDLYFRFLGWSIPTIIVTAAIWIYHHKVAQAEAEKLGVDRLSPLRLYTYLMSFIGLGTTLTGITYLFGVILDRLFGAFSATTVFASDWWSTQLSLALSLLLAGVPVLIYYWRRVLRMTEQGDVGERGARSRRIYLYAILGISIIAAVTTLVLIVYQLINGILQGDFDMEFKQIIIWSLSVFLVALPVLVYHWRVLREDQKLGAEKPVRKKRVNVIGGDEADELVDRIEDALGYHVRRLRYTGESAGDIPAPGDDEIEKLVDDIGLATGKGVIIDTTGGRITLLPYEEK
jgi:hypothetical protein